jgi:SAM-dependent methyltransferase
MPATDRLGAERAFHDRQAAGRAARFAAAADLYFIDDWYLDHESWIRPAFARLGEVAGHRILDLGCGHGMAAVVLARRRARVTALDLSPGYLAEARRRAAANGVAVDFIQANGERLPFGDATFDGVWAHAILHHLDLADAARELHRILRPGGVAVCCEPWGGNLLLQLGRRWLPYPGKDRTADERPLGPEHLPILRSAFPSLHVEGFQLLSMVRRLLGSGRLAGTLQRCDTTLLRRLPALGSFCRYVVLTMRRER